MRKYTFMIINPDGSRELVYTDAESVKEAREEMTRLFKPLGIKYQLNPVEIEEIIPEDNSLEMTEINDRSDSFNFIFPVSSALERAFINLTIAGTAALCIMILYLIIK